MSTHLKASEAAELLGISVPTLYAYVSRGLLHSEPAAPGSRERRYSRAEVENLRARREERRDPSQATTRALDWGGPVLESAITLIEDGRLYYRGLDAVELARRYGFEEVARLLWTGEAPREKDGLPELFTDPLEPLAGGEAWAAELARRDLEDVERLRLLLPLFALDDLAGHDPRPIAMARCGARLLRRMAAALDLESVGDASVPMPLAKALIRAWRPAAKGQIAKKQAQRLMNAALILVADHELNVSSFTARVVASAGSTPYDAVTAGLSALVGRRHGGLSRQVEELLEHLWSETAADAGRLPRAFARRLQSGEKWPGFGHPLYPQGDPRALALLERLPDSSRGDWVRRAAAAGRELTGETPTIDFALGGIAFVLGLRRGAALALFALGRTAGWIGQAIEQAENGALIRPRARYVGPRPRSDWP